MLIGENSVGGFSLLLFLPPPDVRGFRYIPGGSSPEGHAITGMLLRCGPGTILLAVSGAESSGFGAFRSS